MKINRRQAPRQATTSASDLSRSGFIPMEDGAVAIDSKGFTFHPPKAEPFMNVDFYVSLSFTAHSGPTCPSWAE